jgi:Calcineurin-like phosphoesterase
MLLEAPLREGSHQYDFVEESLENASSDSSIDWIIVAMHRQMMYGSSASPVRNPELGLRDAYDRLFQKYGVDLVLYGHNHYYQRKYPPGYIDDDCDELVGGNEDGAMNVVVVNWRNPP